MKDVFLYFIGCLLIWISIIIGRDDKSSMYVFSKNWWIALILTSIGITIIREL